MQIENIQKSLDPVTCPVCNKGKLLAILRCDLDPDGCIAKANCNSCSNTFHLSRLETEDENSPLAVCQVDGMQCFITQCK